MDLRRLNSFVAVAEEAHFGKAAKKLYLSPPSVTLHIKQLEADFGVQLLHRTPVSLTPAGQRLLRHARHLLGALDAARQDLADLTEPGGSRTGRLRVGVMSHGAGELTSSALSAFQHLRPNVPLSVVQLDFQEHQSALLDGVVDVAFIRPVPADERIRYDVLTTESRFAIVSATSRLADAYAEGVPLDEVLDEPFLPVTEVPREFADYFYFAPARGGTPVRQGAPAVVRTPYDALRSVAGGAGVATTVESFTHYHSWPGTAYVPILDAPWENCVLARRGDDDSPSVQTFRALTATLAKNQPPPALDKLPDPEELRNSAKEIRRDHAA
ncbi:LysR substrate-binding domain-containing protein [Streptomyces acidiscabies]|uniref:LysR substrate-binding domain-containing protein n=1 Tax=Streptomyces acidiscabies TaxID=42234 RepID=UPI0038F5D365